jgi:hypothetical protein
MKGLIVKGVRDYDMAMQKEKGKHNSGRQGKARVTCPIHCGHPCLNEPQMSS